MLAEMVSEARRVCGGGVPSLWRWGMRLVGLVRKESEAFGA